MTLSFLIIIIVAGAMMTIISLMAIDSLLDISTNLKRAFKFDKTVLFLSLPALVVGLILLVGGIKGLTAYF
jgi:hypothetical protein